MESLLVSAASRSRQVSRIRSVSRRIACPLHCSDYRIACPLGDPMPPNQLPSPQRDVPTPSATATRSSRPPAPRSPTPAPRCRWPRSRDAPVSGWRRCTATSPAAESCSRPSTPTRSTPSARPPRHVDGETPGAVLMAWLHRFFAFVTSKHHVASELLEHSDGSNPVLQRKPRPRARRRPTAPRRRTTRTRSPRRPHARADPRHDRRHRDDPRRHPLPRADPPDRARRPAPLGRCEARIG